MHTSPNPEYWLRGPVAGIPPALQPVAHALLQSRAEVNALMEGFPEGEPSGAMVPNEGGRRSPAEVLWDRPGGVASPGFHLQHLAGVLDRLLTYARGEALSPGQLEQLAAEGRPPGSNEGGEGRPLGDERAIGGELVGLLERYNLQIDKALQQLAETPELSLTEPRGVGRARMHSTVGGLLFHAAEHSMRHTGQLLVTIRILQSVPPAGNR
jgi:DinB superfamily